MSDDRTLIIRRMYESFNARDIDGVFATLADDVAWANGMDGGHVHGHTELRQYWTRQWSLVSPRVDPVSFRQVSDDTIVVEVIQTVFDLNGKPLAGQAHGLTDKRVQHIFRLVGDKVVRFDIE